MRDPEKFYLAHLGISHSSASFVPLICSSGECWSDCEGELSLEGVCAVDILVMERGLDGQKKNKEC
jgi:hypothetical protein